MIVVTLTYKKPLAEVDAVLKQHIAFLDHYYEQKKFLASGRRENRVGGVILVLSSSIQEAEEIMKMIRFIFMTWLIMILCGLSHQKV